MNHKYVVIESASIVGAEVVGNRIYSSMDEAKQARTARVEELATSHEVEEGDARLAYARSVALSFVKVYELVSVEL